MSDRSLVLVNGVPGSGKTTLARRLSGATGLPLVSRDAVQNAVMSWVEPLAPEPTPEQVRALARTHLWRTAAGLDGGAIVETWFGCSDEARREVLDDARAAGFAEADIVEVWCDRGAAAPATGPAGGQAEPLGVGRLVRVDTSAEVALADLARQVSSSGLG